jgi:zinc transporter family protein
MSHTHRDGHGQDQLPTGPGPSIPPAHPHDHDHDSSLFSRARHVLSEFLGGHSHDAADQVDEALEADSAGRRALLISLAGLAVTAAIQAVVVVLSGSLALRSAVRQVGARLMDAVDPALLGQATAAVTSVESITGVRDLRIRWIGHTLRAEADVIVAADLTLSQAHDLAHHAEAHLLDQVRRLTAATIHTSPAGAHQTGPDGPGAEVQPLSRARGGRAGGQA